MSRFQNRYSTLKPFLLLWQLIRIRGNLVKSCTSFPEMVPTFLSLKVFYLKFLSFEFHFLILINLLDPSSGVIRVAPNVSLDREKQPSYTFTVIAADQPQGSEEQKRSSVLVYIHFTF